MRRFIIIMTALALGCSSAFADNVVEMKGSFLRPLQKRDSILIADQLQYGFRLEGVAAGTQFGFADFSNGFRDSVEVVSSWVTDTLKTHGSSKSGKQTFDIESYITIASFDQGDYDLPRMAVVRQTPDGHIDTLVFDPQSISVKEMPVDTNTFQVHDIKAQAKYPLKPSEVIPYLVAIHFIAILAILVYCIVAVAKKRKENHVEVSNEPAHIVALRKLDKLRGNKLWVPEKQKQFYSGVTDALREYMASRYGVNAMEMTTAEIFRDMRTKDIPVDLYEEMKELFERSDFVKFAKMTVPDEDNAKAVPAAVRFVTSTYQTELDEAEAQEETKKEGEA